MHCFHSHIDGNPTPHSPKKGYIASSSTTVYQSVRFELFECSYADVFFSVTFRTFSEYNSLNTRKFLRKCYWKIRARFSPVLTSVWCTKKLKHILHCEFFKITWKLYKIMIIKIGMCIFQSYVFFWWKYWFWLCLSEMWIKFEIISNDHWSYGILKREKI